MLRALTFLLYVAYGPGLADATILPRWAFLSAAVPVACWFTRGRSVPDLAVAWFQFLLGWALLSSIWSPSPYDSMMGAWQICLLAGVFYLGWCAGSIDGMLEGAAWGLWVSAAIGIVQLYFVIHRGGLLESLETGSFAVASPRIHNWFNWSWFPAVGTPAVGGLFFNKNFLAEAALPIVVGLTYQRRWALIGGPLFCVLVPASRETVLAASLCLAWYLISERRWKILAGFVGTGLVLVGIDASLPHRLDSLVYRANDSWIALSNLQWGGWGLNTFPVLAPMLGHVHNDIVELVSDLGVGAIPLVVIFTLALSGADTLGQLVLIAVLGEALTGFPLHLPVPAFLAAGVAGRLFIVRRLLRDGGAGCPVLAEAHPSAADRSAGHL